VTFYINHFTTIQPCFLRLKITTPLSLDFPFDILQLAISFKSFYTFYKNPEVQEIRAFIGVSLSHLIAGV
jgi:hypothetical protein